MMITTRPFQILFTFLIIFSTSFASTLIEELCDDGPIDPPICPFPLDGIPYNVALNQSTEQSTTYKHGGQSSLAVDGNTGQKFWVERTCSHTAEHFVKDETVPWLRVDLGRPHLIQNVVLYPRSDPCCADRYHDIQIRVGNTIEDGLGTVFSKNGLCNELVGGGKKKGEILHFDCPKCLAGRYVSVQIVRDCVECKKPDNLPNILSICELQIMGYPV